MTSGNPTGTEWAEIKRECKQLEITDDNKLQCLTPDNKTYMYSKGKCIFTKKF